MTPEQHRDLLIRCLDNTAPPERWWDLGVLVFARTFFPEVFDSPFSIMHYNILKQLLEMYNPDRTRRTDRQCYINIHREAAKTTVSSFLFPLYQIYLKGYTSIVNFNGTNCEIKVGERFIMLCSETASAAENLTTNLKTVVETRTDLIPIFGDKHPQAVEVDEMTTRKGDKLWRKNAFITQDGTVVYGIGSGQQVRGKNVLNSRPTLIIVDDMYSSNSVLTEHNRAKLDYWFYAELVNSADSMRGKIAWLGTLVHLDTVITKMKKSDSWFGMVIPVISMHELSDALGHCTITADEVILPTPDMCATLQKTYTTLSWGERHTLYYILSIYKQSYENKKLRYFYQEYINVTEPPEEATFPDSKFLKVPLTVKWVKDPITFEPVYTLSFFHEGMTWTGRPTFTLGIDVASGESAKSDDTVLSVIGLCKWVAVVPGSNSLIDKVLPLFMHIEGGKYGIYDEVLQVTQGLKPGIADAVERLCAKYPIQRVRIEVNGQQGTIAREVRKNMREKRVRVLGTNAMVHYEEQFSQGNKEERIRSVMGSIVQKYEHVVTNSAVPLWNKCITQLQTLGSSDHDDYADSPSIACSSLKLETKSIHKTQQQVPLPPKEDYLKQKRPPDGRYAWESV